MPRTGSAHIGGAGLFSATEPTKPSIGRWLAVLVGALGTLVLVFALIPGQPIPWVLLAGVGAMVLLRRIREIVTKP